MMNREFFFMGKTQERSLHRKESMVAFAKFSFQDAYHQFYVAAGNDIKYSKIHFACKEAHEISHAS